MEGMSAGAVFLDVLPNMAGFQAKLAAGMGSTSFSRRMMTTGKLLTKSLTLPIVGLAAVSTKWAIDFQSEMEMVHTQAGASQNEVKKLSGEVLNLSRSTAQGPQELAKALFHIESVGYRGAKAMKLLKTSTDLAAVGGASLEDTASALGAVVITNIKGTRDYNHAAGILNATIGAGNMRMGDLLEALKSGIIPTAKVAGLSLTGLTSALAMMTDEGVPAGVAANRLRTTLLMMTNPTKKAQTALKGLGLNSLSLGHELQKPDGLVKALRLLQDHMQGIHDKTKRLAIIGDLFGGSRSAGTVAMLLNNLGRVDQKYHQIEKNAKNFHKDVAATQQTDAYKLNSAWSSIQATLIQVGGTLAPFLTEIATFVGTLATAFSGLSGNTQKWILITLGIVAAVGPVLTVFGALTGMMVGVGRGIVTIIGLMPGFSAAMVEGEAQITLFGGAMDVALGPIGLAILGIAAVGLAAAGIIGYFTMSTGATDRLKNATDDAVRAVNGLNVALDNGKHVHQDAVAARHAETAAALAVKSAELNLTKVKKDGHHTSLQLKIAENQVATARDNYNTAANASATATQKDNETRQRNTAKIHAQHKALTGLTNELRNKFIPTGKLTTQNAKAYGIQAQRNADLIKNAGPDYDRLAGRYRAQAAALQATHPKLAQREADLAAQAQATGELVTQWGNLSHLKPVDLRAQISLDLAIARHHMDATAVPMHGGSTKPPKKATGGPVTAGMSYMVGDGVGPELFVPNVDGVIRKDTRPALSGGEGRHALTITNWSEGTGYITELADGSVRRHARLTRQKERMG